MSLLRGTARRQRTGPSWWRKRCDGPGSAAGGRNGDRDRDRDRSGLGHRVTVPSKPSASLSPKSLLSHKSHGRCTGPFHVSCTACMIMIVGVSEGSLDDHDDLRLGPGRYASCCQHLRACWMLTLPWNTKLLSRKSYTRLAAAAAGGSTTFAAGSTSSHPGPPSFTHSCFPSTLHVEMNGPEDEADSAKTRALYWKPL